MKYFILLFTTVLLFLSHYEKIRQIISSSQNFASNADLMAVAPKINISNEELNNRFSPIAENYDFSGTIVIHFIVNEEGKIQSPSFSDSPDPGVLHEIIELIKTAGVKPGMVSGKPTSNGMSLMLVGNKS